MFKKKYKKILEILYIFRIPLLVLVGIVVSLFLSYVLNAPSFATFILIIVIMIGSFDLIKDTVESLIHKKFALDYIALLAITVALISQQYIVAAIIVLMLSGGNTLEDYGMSQAKKSLTALTDRIPNSVLLWKDGQIGSSVVLNQVKVGQEIVVRKGEVIPLDGTLVSKNGLADESSLTGEPYMIEKVKGDSIRSGTVNSGNIMVIRVTKADKESTYRKIISMVQEAQKQKAPLIRLADRYSVVFTIITLVLSVWAYLMSHDFIRVLSVLVIATPCPLILATPIALMGGMNAAAKKRIIMKTLSSIEVLSKVDTMIFDKTGTITLGVPQVKKIHMHTTDYTEAQILGIAEAIERNSLHPLAKALIRASRQYHNPIKRADNVEEIIGKGISGTVDGNRYTLSKVIDLDFMAIQLLEAHKQIAVFEFEDSIKEHSRESIRLLKKKGLQIYVFTGDKKKAAEDVLKQLGEHVTMYTDMSPEDKKNGILRLKREGHMTAMVGDGINDAPALALSDVGMVFSNEEHTAASDAADIVFLGGDFDSVTDVISISKRTIGIALQSILFGIGISTVGMIFAALGYIPPIAGAFTQELIDILVIFNALRASK